MATSGTVVECSNIVKQTVHACLRVNCTNFILAHRTYK
jgi:hypothetical protein